MEALRGVVSHISRSHEISGSSESFSTGQILTCQITGRAVEIWMWKLPVIHEGDEVVVAGETRQGTLIAYAYRNVSNGSNGRWEHNVLAEWYMVIFSGCAVLFFLCAFAPLALLFLPWLAFQLYRLVKIRREAKKTRQAYALVLAG
jgi:hypothetical protein